MQIKLLETISEELKVIGLKTGDVVKADPDSESKVGGLHFDHWHHQHLYHCSIWPQDYEIINNSAI